MLVSIHQVTTTSWQLPTLHVSSAKHLDSRAFQHVQRIDCRTLFFPVHNNNNNITNTSFITTSDSCYITHTPTHESRSTKKQPLDNGLSTPFSSLTIWKAAPPCSTIASGNLHTSVTPKIAFYINMCRHKVYTTHKHVHITPMQQSYAAFSRARRRSVVCRLHTTRLGRS